MALLGAGASLTLLFGFVALQGAGYGVTSIVRPVFVAERLGRRNFGMISGLLAMAYVGGSALSPTIAALLWGIGGYDTVIWFALGASLCGLIALTMAARHPHADHEPDAQSDIGGTS
ncbi:MAG: MFS transporter, partial [Geminicoccaceae bacterium]